MLKDQRVKALIELIPSNSKLVIDVCCDKGHIGRSLIKHNTNIQVLFLDISKTCLDELNTRYKIPNNLIIHNDFITFDFSRFISQKMDLTLLIAGIGSHLIVKFLEQNKSIHGAFLILSPNSHHAVLEHYLQNNPIFITLSKSETFFNKRKYPMYLIETKA